jgi:hypothetical protein
MMEHEALTTYLNDHLAGSVAAIEMLDHLIERAPGPEPKNLYADLRADVAEDQETLQVVIRRLSADESGFRKASAWLTEKLGRLKLRMDNSADGGLHELEAMEALCLGILGKLALWRALAQAAGELESLRGMDLGRLERRAQDQHARAESRRLALARELFQELSPRR